MTMIGTAAIGVVIVDGQPGSVAEFTSGEKDLIIAEVQEGIQNLLALAPASASLMFVPEVRIASLVDDPIGVKSENGWLDKAMIELGYTSLADYIFDLKNNNGADWAYIAFFTKYMTSRFAFARSRDRFCIIRYPERGSDPRVPYKDHGGFRETDMDCLFAHETGHICGAKDENSADVDCLMSTCNPSIVCSDTRSEIGW